MPEAPTYAERIDRDVHMIHQGQVRVGTLDTPLPCGISETCWFEDSLQPLGAYETMQIVRQAATRIALWIRTFVGPRLLGVWSYDVTCSAGTPEKMMPNGRYAYGIGGRAYDRFNVPAGEDEVILMVIEQNPTATLSTLRHELWRVVEARISQAAFEVVEAAVGHGAPLIGEYLGSSCERRARLFENWANAYAEGWRPAAIAGIPISTDRVFLYVYSDGLAKDPATKRPPLPRALPGVNLGRWVLDEVSWQGVLAASMGIAFLVHHWRPAFAQSDCIASRPASYAWFV